MLQQSTKDNIVIIVFAQHENELNFKILDSLQQQPKKKKRLLLLKQ